MYNLYALLILLLLCFQESVDFSFPKFKRNKGVAQSPNVSLKSNNSPSTIHQPKCEEMREEPKLESVKDEEEGPQHSSSSSVSVVSSQVSDSPYYYYNNICVH